MADDKKNIPNAGKADEPAKVEDAGAMKADPSVPEQPAPSKPKAPAVEDVSKATAPPAAEKASAPGVEQSAPPKQNNLKYKDNPTPPKEDKPQPDKTDQQVTIPGMGSPFSSGKVVDFSVAKDVPAKDKPTEKVKDAAKPRRGRPSKADKAAPSKAQPQARDKPSHSKPTTGKDAPTKEGTTTAPEQPAEPRDATRPVKEEIVYLDLSELHAFKDHPFEVRDDAEMQALVESVKTGGVNQPALVRPREGGGYEIVAGHRRQKASELAGYRNMPCIVRNMTDDEAILTMTDDNLRHREHILPMEKARALKQQVEAIKHQGVKLGEDDKDAGKRSTEVVGARNGINYKQVQRYIRLNELVPELQKMVDEKRLSFTPAVEISFIRPKNQQFIAVSIEGEQSSPSLSQAQKMRELDKAGKLNSDVIDGILSEQKKEVDKVIISAAELSKYFGKEATPRQMKDQIMALLDEWKERQPPEKKAELEK